MATYQELYDFQSTPGYHTLVNKILVAVAVKAQDIADAATPTPAQVAWAVSALENPRAKANAIVPYVLAANQTSSITQITNASDAVIQNNVDTAVDNLFGV